MRLRISLRALQVFLIIQISNSMSCLTVSSIDSFQPVVCLFLLKMNKAFRHFGRGSLVIITLNIFLTGTNPSIKWPIDFKHSPRPRQSLPHVPSSYIIFLTNELAPVWWPRDDLISSVIEFYWLRRRNVGENISDLMSVNFHLQEDKRAATKFNLMRT